MTEWFDVVRQALADPALAHPALLTLKVSAVTQALHLALGLGQAALAGRGVALALGEVGITLMLGGNSVGRTNTMSLEIYNAVFNGEYDRAMALSDLLGLVSILACIVLRRSAGRAR